MLPIFPKTIAQILDNWKTALACASAILQKQFKNDKQFAILLSPISIEISRDKSYDQRISEMSKPHKKVVVRKSLKSRKVLKRRRRRRNLKKMKTEMVDKNVAKIEPKAEVDVKEEKPIRKRLYRCCVPHCPTYAPSDMFYPFPSADSLLRRIWLDAIPRNNWFVCHNTLVCKNHFAAADADNDAKDNATEKAVVPTLFPKPAPPNFEFKYRKIDRGMFQIPSNYALPETFGDLALIPNCDKFIFDFSGLVSGYREQLKNVMEVCKWSCQECDDRLVFYRLSADEGCVKISMSVTVDSQLRPTVALEGVIVDPLDCTRHVPVNGCITHWDQLNWMLLDYGYDRPKGMAGQVVPWEVVSSDRVVVG
ncbi:uncharacterized protein LOC123313611 [Coccinella septempunctata]|uniref:uncharacterized protein LOC123313611 n=1 Tax=Coccinella septempunctata TaxID=41139 RepID=UPI001D091182|nr:uncharacterized protein LOC123313611 [Coccinella septempunctata]